MTKRNVRVIAVSDSALPSLAQRTAMDAIEGLGAVKDGLLDPKGAAGSAFRDTRSKRSAHAA